MKKLLFVLFLSLVIGFCFLGVMQMNDATETKVEVNDINPAAEMLQ